MPGLKITIGNREFEVACQPGEEEFLTSAAGLLDEQAQMFAGQFGRIPESRLLLMSGLMLADKITEAQERIKVLEAEVGDLRARASTHTVPESLTLQLDSLAEKAEALAEKANASKS